MVLSQRLSQPTWWAEKDSFFPTALIAQEIAQTNKQEQARKTCRHPVMSTRAARAIEAANLAGGASRDGGGHSKRASGTSAPPAPRTESEQNQVMPFCLDDCEDDIEEIRRRRYSSCSSSSSHEADSRSRTKSNGRKKSQSNTSRDRENDWARASGRAASSSNDEAPYDSDDDDRGKQTRPYRNSGKVHEEPESPRKHHRKTQQSDESNGGSDSDEECAKMVKSSAVATISAAPVPVAIAPRAKAAPSLMPVDLSRISKLTVFPGSETQLLQGHIVRVKTLLHPQYQFFIKDQLILMAEKQLKNRTSNYHIFDMTRTTALSAKLTKKSGNYIGKLRSSFSKKKNVLVGNLSHKTELGAILFGDSTSSSEPRRLNVILPALSIKRQEIEGLTVSESATRFSLLIDMFKSNSPVSPASLQVFENKEPVFDNGFYRLNFNGRVSVPSVKNFQLVRSVNHGIKADAEVCLQFGKVDDKKFHLDFRAPLTPIQTFAIALAQFNL